MLRTGRDSEPATSAVTGGILNQLNQTLVSITGFKSQQLSPRFWDGKDRRLIFSFQNFYENIVIATFTNQSWSRF